MSPTNRAPQAGDPVLLQRTLRVTSQEIPVGTPGTIVECFPGNTDVAIVRFKAFDMQIWVATGDLQILQRLPLFDDVRPAGAPD